MKKQNGQILILGVFFIFIVLIMTFILFNTSQLEFERQKATNISDAAVYSGLQFQAQSLNYMAYTNRAMIANQVAVGQLVSTSSWLDYVSDTTGVIADITRYIPGGQAIAAGLEGVSQFIAGIMETIPAMINATDTTINVLQNSQELITYSTVADTTNLINQIIQANDPRYSITPLGLAWLSENARNWGDFTRNTSSDESLQRQSQVIRASFDGWIHSRENTLNLLHTGVLRVVFNKEGQTRLVSKQDNQGNTIWNWEARDAASVNLHTLTWRGWRRRETPIMTAKIHTTDDNHTGGYWLRREVRRSENYGRLNTTALNTSYSGLRGYRELSERDNPTLTLALEVGTTKNQVRTTESVIGLGPAESTFAHDIETVSAVSKGEIVFKRSNPRPDQRIELSNLFNPYWTARLMDATSEKRQAWQMKGLTRPF